MTNPQRTPEQIVEELTSLFGGDVAIGDEDTITLQSNAGTEQQVAAPKNMTVAEALHMAGIETQEDFEYLVDGTPVSIDDVVAPGTSIYIHTVVEGG